jgi:hypothetical protein
VKKYLIFILLLTMLLCFGQVRAADNGVAYRTWTQSSSGDLVTTQDAYLAERRIATVLVTNSPVQGFKQPEEIYFEPTSDMFYIADTGNHRLLRVDHNFQSATAIGEGVLAKPEGVFVSPEGLVYAADYDLQKVVIFNQKGDIVHEYGKPSHPLYGEGVIFRPSKIVADMVGTMYIVDSGNSNGLVQLTSEGQFLGYFGANYITPNLSYVLRFMFASKAQKKQLYRQPIAPTNMVIDREGLINTVTKGLSGNALKKLNISGANLFGNSMIDSGTFTDVADGPIGNLYALSADGSIFEYDAEGICCSSSAAVTPSANTSVCSPLRKP